MAKFTWKDRVTSTPHRYRMTQVAPDVYDLEATPGSVSEPGTPLNAENMNALIQRNGDDIKDTVVAFAEAGTRANIATGESTATLFGKIKKWYTDLKTHAYTTPSTTQSTSADTVPSSNLLKDSSFARVYRNWSELGIDKDFSIDQLFDAMTAHSKAFFAVSTYDTAFYGQLKLNLPVPFTGSTPFYVMEACKNDTQRMVVRITTKEPNKTQLYAYEGYYYNIGTTNKWSGWKQIITDTDNQTISGVKEFTASPIVPTTPTLPNQAVPKGYVDGVSFAKVYRNLADLELTSTASIIDVGSAMEDDSIAELDLTTATAPNIVPSGIGTQGFIITFKRKSVNVISVVAQTKTANTINNYMLFGSLRLNDTTNKWSGWKQIITNASTSDGVAIGNDATATSGGAVGYSANATNGGAVGSDAKETSGGGAVGYLANATYGGAVGHSANATYGGAIGYQARANSGGAVGGAAKAFSVYASAFGYNANVAANEGHTIRLGDNENLSSLKCKVELTVTSDERDKTDINNITNCLDFIDKLTPITYKSNQRTVYLTEEQKNSENYKKYGLADYDKQSHARGDKKGGRQRVGLKAQEIQEALLDIYGTDNYANIVDDNFYDLENKPTDVENQLTVAYSNLIPFLIGAIKEQQAMITQMQQEISTLKGEQTNGNNR